MLIELAAQESIFLSNMKDWFAKKDTLTNWKELQLWELSVILSAIVLNLTY